ncbi:MAG: PSD1 and planctomycete cytochrome C domain-containing protein [Pirellulales bacterium]
MLVCLAVSWCGHWLPTAAIAQEASDTELAGAVRGLLLQKCQRCHGPNRQESGLRVDGLEHLTAEADLGRAVVPGNPAASLLYLAVSAEHDDLTMPPDDEGPPLTSEEVALVRKWIERDAPWSDAPIAMPFSDAERSWWSLQRLGQTSVPVLDDDAWCRNEIDRFVLSRLQEIDVVPAPEAPREVLVRRIYFDLVGLPPAPEELARWCDDAGDDWLERLADELLASPHYGERWARHWLDLVRYAESDGFKADVYRPHAWHYRDYVVRSLNDDKPFDRFLQEQLAGDELFPDDRDARVATGYLRLWPLEDNQKDVRRQWTLILDDITEVTGDVFLGLSMRCARCHDHKYDPIRQVDYYRLRAYFAALLPRDDLSVVMTLEEQAAQAQWEDDTRDLRRRMRALDSANLASRSMKRLPFFPEYLQAVYRQPPEQRTPLDRQYAYLAEPQFRNDLEDEDAVIETLAPQREQLLGDLSRFDDAKPESQSIVMCVTDVGAVAPPTYVGNSDVVVEPGVLSILDAAPASIAPLGDERVAGGSTGRRTALARWLCEPDHPLTARVFVNRVWQQHFGRGIVATPNDFGRLGSRPSHPLLLDWLARRLIDNAWSVKQLHRLMVTSATYRQSSLVSEVAAQRDPDGELLSRMPLRRLEAEQIRDAMLAVSGELDDAAGGPAVKGDSPRRSIYLRNVRNLHDEMLAAYDGPDMFNSCPRRFVTTTPLQSLLTLNGEWALTRAAALADRVMPASTESMDDAVARLYLLVLARSPNDKERDRVAEFLQQYGDDAAAQRDAWVDVCHVLLCSNEFIYVD